MKEGKSIDFRPPCCYLKRELLFKFVVIGDFGVGKTSIIKRYTDDTFSTDYKITIGADFSLKTIEWDEDTNINLQLWDIAGHERFGCLTGVYYKYAAAALIVFDLTRPQTFNSVEKWLIDLRNKTLVYADENIPVILLANKGDMDLTNIPANIAEFCQNHNIAAWFITSAKENVKIDYAIDYLLKIVIRNQNADKKSQIRTGTITLKMERQNRQSTRCCSIDNKN